MMEGRKDRSNELDARLREIENELRSLRGALDHQGRVVSEIHSAIAGLQKQLSSLAGAKTKPKRISRLAKQLRKAFEEAIVYFGRFFLRANIEDLFDRGYYRSLVPGLAESGVDPAFHYLFHRSAISPHWLFDRDYYLVRLIPMLPTRRSTHWSISFVPAGGRAGIRIPSSIPISTSVRFQN